MVILRRNHWRGETNPPNPCWPIEASQRSQDSAIVGKFVASGVKDVVRYRRKYELTEPHRFAIDASIGHRDVQLVDSEGFLVVESREVVVPREDERRWTAFVEQALSKIGPKPESLEEIALVFRWFAFGSVGDGALRW